MTTSRETRSPPEVLLYTVYVPPINPTPVPGTLPTKKDELLIALTWSDGVRKFNPRSMDSDPAADPDRDIDFYRPISRSDHRAWDWLNRMGAWPDNLTDSLFRSKVGGGQCMVFELPDGYTLYEKVHIPAKGRYQAGRDTYLFGHPSGETFETPEDFQPHYIWMACDLLKDRNNCRCRLCKNDKAKGEHVTTGSAFSKDSVDPAKWRRAQHAAPTAKMTVGEDRNNCRCRPFRNCETREKYVSHGYRPATHSSTAPAPPKDSVDPAKWRRAQHAAPTTKTTVGEDGNNCRCRPFGNCKTREKYVSQGYRPATHSNTAPAPPKDSVDPAKWRRAQHAAPTTKTTVGQDRNNCRCRNYKTREKYVSQGYRPATHSSTAPAPPKDSVDPAQRRRARDASPTNKTTGDNWD